MLYSAEYEGVHNTEYGPAHQASVNVGDADRKGDPKDYRVFGRLAEQVKQVEPGELPALVRIAKVGRGYSWEPVTAPEEPLDF